MRRVLKLILEELFNGRNKHGADEFLFHEMRSVINDIGVFPE